MRTDETPRRGTYAVLWRGLINSAGAVSNIIYLLLVAPYERDKNRACLQVAESELRKLMRLMLRTILGLM